MQRNLLQVSFEARQGHDKLLNALGALYVELDKWERTCQLEPIFLKNFRDKVWRLGSRVTFDEKTVENFTEHNEEFQNLMGKLETAFGRPGHLFPLTVLLIPVQKTREPVGHSCGSETASTTSW